MNTKVFFTAIAALLPALHAWISGRRIEKQQDDHAFPELLYGRAKRSGQILLLAYVLLILLNPPQAVPWVLATFLAWLLGGFGSRRRIFGEHWSFPAYLGFLLRLTLAMLGPFFLLLLLPTLFLTFGLGALVPTAIAVLLWTFFGDRIFIWLLGAKTLDQPQLEAPFEKVLAGARCPRPALHQAGPRGGHFINAFAIPSLRQPRVLFSKGLLEVMETRESAAIFAHEVAHLEEFQGRRWRTPMIYLCLLTFLLAALFWIGRDSHHLNLFSLAWTLVLLVAFLNRNQRLRRNETASDLRALELWGNGQDLIDGLSKLQRLSRLPRRMDAAHERNATHPSLARRIQAIRQAEAQLQGSLGIGHSEEVEEPAGTPPAPEPSISAQAFRDARNPSRAVVITDRIHFLEGLNPEGELDAATCWQKAPRCTSLPYEHLQELRINARGGKRDLRAVDLWGTTRGQRIEPTDLGRLQEALAGVDTLLGEVPPRRKIWGLGPRAGALVSFVLAAMPPFHWPMLPLALLCLLRPSKATMAALGTAALGSPLLLLSGAGLPGLGPGFTAAFLGIKIIAGLLWLWAAWRRSGQDDPPWTLFLTVGLCLAFAILASLGLLAAFQPPRIGMRLHLWATGSIDVALLLAAAAAAALTRASAMTRPLGMLLLASVLGILTLGSHTLGHRLSGDPLAKPGPDVATRHLRATPLREVVLETGDALLQELRLSPSGKRIAVGLLGRDNLSYDEPPGAIPMRFLLETGPEQRIAIEALDLHFLDDDRALLLETQGEVARLRLLVLEGTSGLGGESWEITLPTLEAPTLAVDSAALMAAEANAGPLAAGSSQGSWLVLDRNTEAEEVRRWSGRVGSPEIRYRSWPMGQGTHGDDHRLLLAPGAGDLALGLTFRQPPLMGGPLIFFDLFHLGMTTVVDAVRALSTDQQSHQEAGQEGRLWESALTLDCFSPAAGDRQITCASDEGIRSYLWRLAPDSAAPLPLGPLPKLLMDGESLPGGRLLLTAWGESPWVVDLETGARFELQVPPDKADSIDRAPGWLDLPTGPYVSATAVGESALALAYPGNSEIRIALYRLPPEFHPPTP